MARETAKKRETARIPSLEWMHEFDSQLQDIDSRLTPPSPRARAQWTRADEKRTTRLRPGKRLIIRYQLPWPFSLLQRRRRREHPLTTVRPRA